MKFLDSFINDFRDGFQQQSRFMCQVIPPPALLDAIITPNILVELIDIFAPSIGARLDRNFAAGRVSNWLQRGIVCEATRLPSRTLQTHDQNMYGLTEKFPNQTTYLDLDCTFMMPLVSTDCPLPRFFSYWQNFIHNAVDGPESGMNFTFPDNYYSQIILTTYTRKDHKVLSYMFDKVYPLSVESVPLSWDTQNEFGKQNVTFAYSYWKMLPHQPPPLIEIDININGR